MEPQARNPIAIVGIGCRMPGGIRSPDGFWEVIRDGRDTITEVPPDRWSLDNYYHPDQSKQGKMISRKGGFIEGIDKFDNSFFKISPKEANSMDPQQRILLEVVHEAFEDAGIISDTIGASGGVYVGIGMIDYAIQTISETSLINPYMLTGMSHCTAANRISYAFDLRGPSYAVDTACASSVTAIHNACTGIWNEECETAVVAGCNAVIIPETSIAFSALGALSKDGKCCPFSNTANGYVRSEGWGALILKTVQKAEQDGDHIYALIRGTAIAANGFSNSLTMPSCRAQEYVMKQAFTRSGISLSDVQYVEAHGTGTPVGDPVEAEAIGNTFGPHRMTPLKIGSAKGNFGHNEYASGITAAIKVALMLDHQMLCPTINFAEINPNIKTDEWKLQVQTQLEKLPSQLYAKKTTVGLNSAGFGGAVGHVILETAPRHILQDGAPYRSTGWQFGGNSTGNPIVVPLSAKSREALNDVAEQWREFKSDCDAVQVVSWMSTRRNHYGCRLAVISNSSEVFREQMDTFLAAGGGNDISVGAKSKTPKICFVFPGQGQQWGRMGQKLFLKENIFREAVLQCDEIFKQLSGWSLLYDKHVFITVTSKDSENTTPDDEMNDTAILQPAILFFQVGLLNLLRSWGVFPDVIVGHSLGEVAGAYASGSLTISEAVRVIYHRSCQQAKLKGAGSMAALRLSLPEAKDLCQNYEKLYVAAINAPVGITIAGNSSAISEITLSNPTVAKRLRVQCAFHTPFMDPMEKPFRAAMEGAVKTEPGSGSIPFYSTVTGKLYNGGFGTDYWWKNIRGTVKFQIAMEEICKNNDIDVFLEIGASATLLSSVSQICRQFNRETSFKLIHTGQREQDDHFTLLRALANLYVAGCTINWEHATTECATWIRLPTYPWQHKSFWLEDDERRQRRLGLDDRTFKGQAGNISLEIFPFLADHVVQDQLVFPGAGFVEMIIQSVFAETERPALSKVSFHKLLSWTILENGNTKPLGLQCHREGHNVEVTSDGVSCTSAKIEKCVDSDDSLLIEEILSRCTTRVTGADIYQKLEALGLRYGPSFQVIKDAAVGDGEVVGFLQPVQTDNRQRMQVTHVDGCLQLLLIATGVSTSLYLPVSMKLLQMNVTALPATEVLIGYVRVTDLNSSTALGDLMIATRDGKVLLKVQDCECHNITGTKTGVRLDSCLYITEMQSMQACLPKTSIANEKFEVDYLQTNFPDEMGFIARAECWIPSLEAVCALYIRQVLTAVKEEQIDQGNIQYFKRLNQLSEITSPDCISDKDVESVLDNIETNLPELQQEVAILRYNLPHTLTNQSPAVLNLSDTPGMNISSKDSAMTRVYYKIGADIIHSAVKEAVKRKQVVRILEVGGELGGLAKHVLPLLRELCEVTRVEYTLGYSDSYPQDPLFDEFPFVKYQQLDIESDVMSQGLVPGSIDVIICMNNIHSSEDLSRCLRNIHKILCDGGWFFMCELTKMSCIAEVLFGGMQRSWRFDDFRQGSCWLTQEGWKDALKTCGFKDVVSVSTAYKFLNSVFVCCKVSGGDEATLLGYATSHTSLLIIKDQEASSASNLSSLLCEKLNIAGKITYLEGKNPKKFVSQNSQTREGNLICIYNNSAGSLYQLTKLLQDLESKILSFRRVFVVTIGAMTDVAQAVGLIRSVTNGAQTPIYSLHMEDTHDESTESLLTLLNNKDVWDREITICKGKVSVPRVLRTTLPHSHDVEDGSHWQLVLNQNAGSKYTSIEDLGFSPLNDLEPHSGEVVVNVRSSALNFKDVMTSMGLLDGLDNDDEDTPHFGLECCGTIEKVGEGVSSFSVGDEVMGFGKHCFASHTICDAELVVHRPAMLDWNKTAGICVVFSTAYYSLIKRANLQKGETVLIHSACGGVGLAAIQVAKMVGARIICSAGSDQKRSYLRNHLGVEMVTDSRTERFYDDVMVWTDGVGVDVVLNSLHGERLSKGVEALAPGGRFCEIGKRDILQNSSLQMNPLLENKSFMSCQIDRMIIYQKAKVHLLLQEVASLFGANGPLTTIPTTVYPIKDYQDTFTIMAKGDHIGKLVFDIPSEFKPSKLLPSSRIFDANATYIVTGGYGGLGLAFARWLCNRGVCHLALVSRSGCHTDAARRTVRYVKKKGTVVYHFALDISKPSDVKAMLSKLQNAPVVKGIFHLAGCIMDESLSSLNPEMMAQIMGAKATGARNLHTLTQHLPMEVFFLMSSSTAVWGHSSQPCYTAANNYMDALAVERRRQGRPAISFQLGVVRGAGFVETNPDTLDTLEIKGSLTLHIDEVLQIVGKILQARDIPAVLTLSNQNWNKTLQFCHTGNLRFRHLTQAVKPRRSICVTNAQKKLLEDKVRQKMARLLCVDPDGIDLEQPMVNYGVDSLMAVEMVAWSSKELSVSIKQVEILGGITTGDYLQRVLMSQTE